MDERGGRLPLHLSLCPFWFCEGWSRCVWGSTVIYHILEWLLSVRAVQVVVCRFLHSSLTYFLFPSFPFLTRDHLELLRVFTSCVSFSDYHTAVWISKLCRQLLLRVMLPSHNISLSITSVILSSSGTVAHGEQRKGQGVAAKSHWWSIMTNDAQQRETFLTVSVIPLLPTNQCQPVLKMPTDNHPKGLKDRPGWGWSLKAGKRAVRTKPYIIAPPQIGGRVWVTCQETVLKGGWCSSETTRTVCVRVCVFVCFSRCAGQVLPASPLVCLDITDILIFLINSVWCCGLTGWYPQI